MCASASVAGLLNLLSAIIVIAWREQETRPSHIRQFSGNTLTGDQLNQMLAEAREFREDSQRRMAEADRLEARHTQERIAAAARQYKEQRDRERAQMEETHRKEAQREEQTRREEAERQAAIEAKQKEADRIAAEKKAAEQKAAQAKKEREQAERDRIAAERARQAAAADKARQEKEREIAQLAEETRQRELAARLAKESPATELLSKADLESIMGFKFRGPKDIDTTDLLSLHPLEGVEKVSSCYFDSDLPENKHFNNGVRLTVRYLTENNSDRAEEAIRSYFSEKTSAAIGGVKQFDYSALYIDREKSICVFKPTPLGCTLLEVAIDGASSEASQKNGKEAFADRLEKEKKIALKILGPTGAPVDPYEVRHPAPKNDEESASEKNYLPDIPGVDSQTRRFFNGFLNRAARPMPPITLTQKELSQRAEGEKSFVRNAAETSSWCSTGTIRTLTHTGGGRWPIPFTRMVETPQASFPVIDAAEPELWTRDEGRPHKVTSDWQHCCAASLLAPHQV